MPLLRVGQFLEFEPRTLCCRVKCCRAYRCLADGRERDLLAYHTRAQCNDQGTAADVMFLQLAVCFLCGAMSPLIGGVVHCPLYAQGKGSITMSYQPKALRALLAAGLTAVLCAGATVTALPAVAAETTLRVIQHNTDQIPERWNDVLKLAGDHDVLLAEEVCEKSFEAAQKKAKEDNSGWTFSFHRQALTPAATGAPTCPESENGTKSADGTEHKTWKGLVAVHTGKGGAAFEKFFNRSDDPKVQIFGMACVKFHKDAKKVTACATHLALGSEAVRTQQTQKIKKFSNEWINAEDSSAVVVGGDFNSQPGTPPMTNMYKYPDGAGRFVEGHQLATGIPERKGKPTVVRGDVDPKPQKIDYVFFDAKHTPLNSGGTFNVVPVDGGHAVLKATAHIKNR